VAPFRAENLLLEMQQRSENGERKMRPRASHYTAVINAWSRSRHLNSLSRAKEIFEQVHAQYLKGSKDVIPDIVLYGSIISTCARAGDIDGIERFATLMIADSLQGNKSAEPSTQVLNSMLIGVLRSKRPSLARSNRLVDLMKRANVRTDKRTEQLLTETQQKSREWRRP
jgi:hypothetical protein